MKTLRGYTATYILGLIIVYAALLRLYHLGEPSFWIDEGFSSYSTLAWHNLSYYIHNISQWLSFSLWGVSDWSARFPSVVFSLMSIVLVYLITKKLTNNPLVALMPALLITISYMDIAWARQARFYSLLQLVFLLQIYLTLLLYYGNKYWYLILSGLAVTLYIGAQFHPFLYTGVLISSMILGLSVLENYKTLWKTRTTWLKKIRIPLGSFGVIGGHYVMHLITASSPLRSTQIPHSKDSALIDLYTESYISVLMSELGVVFFIYLGSLLYFAWKREFMRLILFFFTLFIPLTIFAHQGFMYHDRYIYFIFSTLTIAAVVALYELYKHLSLGYLKLIFINVCTLWIYISFHHQVHPKVEYHLGHTSPQVDFKSAYAFLPESGKVITPFPTLCRWYYGERGSCVYSVAVDIVGNTRRHEHILERGEERYTQLAYLRDLQDLEVGETYYIVLDALGRFGWIETELRDTLLSESELIYQHGESYRAIEVYLYQYQETGEMNN